MSSKPGFSGFTDTSSPHEYHLHAEAARRRETHHIAHVTPIDMAGRYACTLSLWSSSVGKRAFDIGCVLCSLPMTIPLFLVIGLAVRLTSRGPVLFRQQRMGKDGRAFTIFKFRTMPVRRQAAERPNVTTSINQRFTPVGPILRRWKLDELPQLINVLRGDMSLVGPRPKLPSHQPVRLNCRPGITGRATIVFAREEVVLSPLPTSQLDAVYHTVVLPLKQRLDEEYMRKATFSSDLKLILDSVLRRWEDLELRHLLESDPTFAQQFRKPVEKSIQIAVARPHQSATLRSEFQAD